MTTPFSPNYKPSVDLRDVARDRKISETRTKQRQSALCSSDPDQVKQAQGSLGKLSKRGGRKA